MKKFIILLIAMLSIFASSTKTGGTAANSGSGVSWSNLSLAQSCSGSYASVTLASSSSKYLLLTNFGFSIPTAATINGIKLDITWTSTLTDGGIYESSIQLVKEGTQSGSDYSGGNQLPEIFPGVYSYGGSTDLWGTTWTPANWNNSTSGCRIKVNNPDGLTGDIAYVDCAQITVYYTESGVKRYLIGYCSPMLTN